MIHIRDDTPDQSRNESQLKDLARVRDNHLSALQKLGNYTTSWVGQLQDGRQGLVIGYDPLTPEIERAVRSEFANYPIEVKCIPVARSHVLRHDP